MTPPKTLEKRRILSLIAGLFVASVVFWGLKAVGFYNLPAFIIALGWSIAAMGIVEGDQQKAGR